VGLEGFTFDNWFGLFAPRGTPAAVINRLVEANRHALGLAAAQERLAGIDMIAAASAPEELRARTEREFALYGEAIRRAEIRAE
jgi:tripartite-type tricarboxylate transporter receptor subunit TctC